MSAPGASKKTPKRVETTAEVMHPIPFHGDDATLVQGMLADNSGAYRAFYRRNAPFVYRVLLRTLGSDEELDILIQEVFTKAFECLHTLKQASQVKPWLAAVAVNTARDTIRQRRRMRWLQFFDPSKIPEPNPEPPEGSDADLEALETVYRLLDKLSVEGRIAFTLRYMNEMSLEEVASACGVSLATIKRRLAKARKQLHAMARTEPVLRKWVDHE